MKSLVETNKIYDLIIIGAAAAGCSAAVYAARRGLNFVVVTKDIGGEVALSGEVENWPGTIHTDGITLAQQFYKHAQSYGVKFDEGFFVKEIIPQNNTHLVRAENSAGEKKEYLTKTVIVGSGIHPRLLGIPGEEKLRGKGVTYCTVCDGPLFRNKITVTVGAGNAALESILMMGGLAKKVYLLTKFPNTDETHGGFPKGEKILIDKVKALSNVEIIYGVNTTEIVGNAIVSGLTYETSAKKKKTLDAQGVMVHIGNIPNSNFIDCVKKNPLGEIIVDMTCKTSCPGIFAAGDVTNIPFKQIAIAAGQGVTAALSAIDYVNKWQE